MELQSYLQIISIFSIENHSYIHGDQFEIEVSPKKIKEFYKTQEMKGILELFNPFQAQLINLDALVKILQTAFSQSILSKNKIYRQIFNFTIPVIDQISKADRKSVQKVIGGHGNQQSTRKQSHQSPKLKIQLESLINSQSSGASQQQESTSIPFKKSRTNYKLKSNYQTKRTSKKVIKKSSTLSKQLQDNQLKTILTINNLPTLKSSSRQEQTNFQGYYSTKQGDNLIVAINNQNPREYPILGNKNTFEIMEKRQASQWMRDELSNFSLFSISMYNLQKIFQATKKYFVQRDQGQIQRKMTKLSQQVYQRVNRKQGEEYSWVKENRERQLMFQKNQFLREKVIQ